MDISGSIDINKKKFGKYDPKNNIDGLVFGHKKYFVGNNKEKHKYEELTGINVLDSNVINPNDLPVTPARLEMQLENAEKKLKKINSELKANEKVGVTDFETTKKLYFARHRVKQELDFYRKQYREQGLTYKITDSVNQIKNTIQENIELAGEKLQNSVAFGKFAQKIPAYRRRNQVEKAQILNKKLENEMANPVRANSRNVEVLLSRADKLIPPKTLD